MPKSMAELPHDDPRRKLIEAATKVFAEVGYQAATVREICTRAGQNVAAVNYHFGDKYGLYTQILQDEVDSYSASFPEKLLDRLPPEEAFRVFIQNFLRHLGNADRPAWHTKVMMHELGAPTQGLAAVVELIIRPQLMTLAGIISRLTGLPPTHPKTRLCVHSVIGQMVHYVHGRPALVLMWPDWKIDSAELEVIADHIADFSIAALKSIKKGLAKEAATIQKPQ